MTDVELVVIGGGPAGLTAGIYAGRAKLDTVVIEKMMPGGQIASSDMLENYPGFPEGIAGWEIGMQMQKQCDKWGARFISSEVKSLSYEGEYKIIETDKESWRTRAVIIAGGARPRPLDIPGEREFAGRGVSWCATCDGALYTGKKVLVIGGGNSALEESLFLTKFASEVVIIQDQPDLSATPLFIEKARQNAKISILTNKKVLEIAGGNIVEKLRISDNITGAVQEIPTNGVFIFIGMIPNTEWLGGAVAVDAEGYILTDVEMKTRIPGVYAAGDIRVKEVRQVTTAVGDGTIAAVQAERYLAAIK